jgi:hypothetical protein
VRGCRVVPVVRGRFGINALSPFSSSRLHFSSGDHLIARRLSLPSDVVQQSDAGRNLDYPGHDNFSQQLVKNNTDQNRMAKYSYAADYNRLSFFERFGICGLVSVVWYL